MTATIAPLPTSEERGNPLRLLPISVNLLPAEIVNARASRKGRLWTAGVLLLAILAAAGWYYHARQQTADARHQVAQAQDDARLARRGLGGFAELNQTKEQISVLHGKVGQATKGDVAWTRLVPAIRRIAPQDVRLTSITGTALVGTQTGTAGATAGQTGTIVLTGEAPSKATISLFTQRLASVSGLADPLLTSVATDSSTKQLTFSVQAETTSRALSTRYSGKAGK